jgi:hypothetical protein
MRVYALKDKTVFKWQPATLSHIVDNGSSSGTHVYRCKFEHKKQCGSANRADNSTAESDDIDNGDAIDLESTFVAHSEPVDQDFVLPVKTRIVTLYQNENECRAPFLSVGTICEIPNARNLNRYLVFFDDGFAQYIQRNEAFQVFEPYMMPVNQINEHHLEFLYRYFLQYPEKAMMRLHKDNVIQANYKNKWYKTRVVNVDCSLVRLHFEGTEHSEWLYRGSYRLLPFYTRLKDETIDGQMFMFNIAEYKGRQTQYKTISRSFGHSFDHILTLGLGSLHYMADIPTGFTQTLISYKEYQANRSYRFTHLNSKISLTSTMGLKSFEC